MPRDPQRLGLVETVAAWLRLWTPPRDAVIPPVPWRRVAIGFALVAAAVAAVAAFALPRLADRREAGRERAERAAVERRAVFLAYARREQRPRRTRGRGRRALLATAESAIAADARRRTRDDVKGVQCDPFPRSVDGTDPFTDRSRSSAAFDCVAITSRFGAADQPGGRGIIGTPFRLKLDFTRGTAAWCRIVPMGDRDRLSFPLPRACRADER